VNTIVGAQLLHAVNGKLPGYGGILIIASATFFVSLFGYKIVHAYEFWSWIPSSGLSSNLYHPPARAY
jgi:purine-cytosine permease-like protein